jgi:hypothetical protein
MTVQAIIKGVLKGRLFNAIEVRNVFYYGCALNSYYDVGTGDIDAIHERLADVASQAKVVAMYSLNYYATAIYNWDGEHWILYGEYQIDETGLLTDQDALPSQIAMLLRFTTGAFRMIGHKYLAGLGEACQAAGILNGNTLDALIAVGAAIMEDAGYMGHIWHPGIPGKSSAFAPFLSCLIPDLLSTMRRRKLGVGI